MYLICLEYLISVFYYSYKLVKCWNGNVCVIVCVGLLYDLFYYDWCIIKFDEGFYVYVYLWIVVKNVEKIIELFDLEWDIIIKYMWGVIIVLLKYKESYIVIFVDKYCVVKEVVLLMMIVMKIKWC